MIDFRFSRPAAGFQQVGSSYFADPDFVDVPIESLASKEYAAERVKVIDPIG